MAEYASMFAVSGIATDLFLGGWHTGFLPFDLIVRGHALGGTAGFIVGNMIIVVVFIVKCQLLVFVMMWVRWTLPRLRIDQVMMTCLKYLIPISCVLVMGVSLWLLVMPTIIQVYFKWIMLALCLVAIGAVAKQLHAWVSAPPSTGMPG